MPLKAYIEHKAVIAYLRKVDRLKESADRESGQIEHEVRFLFPSDYDQENEDAQTLLEQKYEVASQNKSIKLYRGVSHQLFGHHNGRIRLKEKKLSDYNLYTTALDTYPFFATYLIELSRELINKHQRAHYLLAHLDESFSFDGNLEEQFNEISDIHIHLGAAMDFHYRIHEVLKAPESYDKIENHFEPQEHSLDKPARVFKRYMFKFMSIFESAIIAYYLKIESEYILDDVWNALQKLFDNNISEHELEDTVEQLMSNLQSIRNKNFPKEYLEYEENPVEHLLLVEAINYFNIDNEKIYNPKKGDKALVVYIMKKYLLEENKQSYRIIESYLLMRNIFKSTLFQQHRRSGFGYFTSYSRNKIKKETHASLKHILQSIFHPEISSNAELRISVAENSSDLHRWFVDLHQTINEINREVDEESGIQYKVKTIFHLIKQKEPNSDGVRYAKSRERYKADAFVLSQFLTKQGVRYYNDSMNGKAKNKNVVDLAYQYFHGIDGASNELYTPPEVFAPVYSFFKNSVISSGFAIDSDECVELPKRVDLQYTFHVGEEYRDIISGVRSIFEAIIFLNLKDEDRLGHAVALGIDPKILLEDRKHITLTKGEYMDNLVFLYYMLSMSNNPPYSLEEIRSIVEQLGNEIYGNVSNKIGRTFTIDDYIAAWLLRRNCPLQVEKIIRDIGYSTIEEKVTSEVYDSSHVKSRGNYETAWNLKLFLTENVNDSQTFLDLYSCNGFESSYLKASLPDFFYKGSEENEPLKRYLSIRNNQKAYVLYWAYASNDKEVMSHYSSFYEGNILFPEKVYEYLQDFVMEKYVARRDIVVEILPTSNLLITSIGKYENHPFLRLHSPKEITPNSFNIRTKKIKLALGTDDPGIHGTSLMMEYHILNDIISKKYSKRIAEKYLKELANFSNYLFEKGRKG